MTRLLSLFAFAVTISAVVPAFAKKDDDRQQGRQGQQGQSGQSSQSVPELSSSGTAAGLALLAGATAIAFGRKRARRS